MSFWSKFPIHPKQKEEQLKLKEVAINDTMTEKNRILDRMYKAEARNLEMEHTVKNLQNRIEMLESTIFV
jgi:hypothetical protein